MNENKMENKEIMEQELPTTETAEMTAEEHTEATEDVIVEAGAVCDGADEIVVDETAEGGEDTLVVEAAAPVKKIRKRSIALIAAIICMLAVAVGGTYAYFTATGTTVNVITMRGLEMVLHEEDEFGNDWGTPKEDEDGNTWREVTGVMPSNSIAKVVYVENYLEEGEEEAAKADFYTRILLTMHVLSEDGTKEFPAEEFEKYIAIGYDGAKGHNKTDWQYDEDTGYYYYIKDHGHGKGVVKPGEVTTPLMSYVSFDKTMPNEYQNVKVVIDIEAQATQSKNNKPDPLEAAW